MKSLLIQILFSICISLIISSPLPLYLGNGIHRIGVNDPSIKLFEGQYPVSNGMSYNSYAVIDGDEVAIFDTVDQNFLNEWFRNIEKTLGDLVPKYLIVQHMEPDHAANIDEFAKKYTNAIIVSSAKAFKMMKNFFKTEYEDRRIIVKEGSTLTMGSHTFAFIEAPMVHWPEVIVTYEISSKTLFSADGFGKFGVDYTDEPWDDEARRYYIGIVGKYGKQVQSLLNKAATLNIQMICPTHGPVLRENLGHYIKLYKYWSSYEPEEDGIVIAYTSVYGHTKRAVEDLAEKLKIKGAPNVVIHDLAREHVSYAVSDAFRYSKIILATTTYNADIFPPMRNFLWHLTERNFQGRTVAFVENGSWGIQAKNIMMDLLENSQLTYAKTTVTISSALSEENEKEIEALTDELTEEYRKEGNVPNIDKTALFNIGYGLYVITSNDGKKDNGFICNAVIQLTSRPTRIGVTINKDNYSYQTILKTKIMNINIINTEAPFELFKHFGFQSGRTVNKFEDFPCKRTNNGLPYLTRYINSVISLKVVEHVELGTHGMFVCEVTESIVFDRVETMTYSHYQSCVKPKKDGGKGYVCKVCGFVYEGDTLPNDYICPLCKHCADDFEKIKRRRLLAELEGNNDYNYNDVAE